jgi:hypothetical protein
MGVEQDFIVVTMLQIIAASVTEAGGQRLSTSIFSGKSYSQAGTGVFQPRSRTSASDHGQTRILNNKGTKIRDLKMGRGTASGEPEEFQSDSFVSGSVFIADMPLHGC